MDVNQKAELLAKRGTEISIKQDLILLDTLWRSLWENIMSGYNTKLSVKLMDKNWEKIKVD